jgi:hypothetical protein
MTRMRFWLPLAVVVLLPGASGYAQTPFYQGKTITIIQAREPGGTGDMRVRALIPFLRKYIPGEPAIVSEYMPGGGGRKAANQLFRGVRPDGLTIGNVGAGLVSNAILGQSGVQYDIDRFIYLGSPNSASHYVFKTAARLGLSTLEKLRAHSGIRIGAQTVGHDIYMNGRLFAWLLGLKDPKFITGYSGPELDTAMLQGELDARANIADTILKRTPDFVDKGLMHFHAIIEIPRGDKHPRFSHGDVRPLGAGAEAARDVPRLPARRLPLHPAPGHAGGPRRDPQGGDAQSFQGPRVSQGVQEAHRGRSYAFDAGGDGEGDPRAAAGSRDDPALQNPRERRPAAASLSLAVRAVDLRP